jgi:protein gp37
MGEGTKIAWCSDTWNPWIGCTKFSAECLNCYADTLDLNRFSKTLGGATTDQPIRHWGPGRPRHRTNSFTDGTVLAWNRRPLVCDTCGLTGHGLCLEPGDKCPDQKCDGKLERRRVFCGSLMDWADEEVPDSWRDQVFTIAEQCTGMIFMFLTKRGENAMRYIKRRYPDGAPAHFWGGMSYMGDRPGEICYLVNTPWRTRFLSVEPMLGPVMLHGEQDGKVYRWLGKGGIDQVIFGGESGPDARPCNIAWIRNGVWQCRAGGAAPYVKQLGARPVEDIHDYRGGYLGFQRLDNIRDPKGGKMAEWPVDLRGVREFPLTEPNLEVKRR